MSTNDTTFIPSHNAGGAEFKRGECANCGTATSYVEVADVWVHDSNGRENCAVFPATTTEHVDPWDGINWTKVAQAAAYDPWSTVPANTRRPQLNEREELLAQAARKPVRQLTQIDIEHEPRDENGDREGDVIWTSTRSELRQTDFPVRVQILDGTDRAEAVRLLRKVLDLLESEAVNIKKLSESHSAAELRAAADLADKQPAF